MRVGINSKTGMESLICHALTEDLAHLHHADDLNDRDLQLNLTHRLDVIVRAAGDTLPATLDDISKRNRRLHEAAAIMVGALLEPTDAAPEATEVEAPVEELPRELISA